MVKKTSIKTKSFILMLCVFVIAPSFCLLGFYLGKNSPQPPTATTATTIPETESSDQQLVISAQISHENESTTVSLPGSEQTVLFCNLSDVRITLEDGTHDLKAALEDGLVTPEEIISWAKQDAAKGICKEIFSSNNGLTNFIYRYAQLELSVYDDVYETPDGKQHLIRDLTIRESGGSGFGVSFSYTDENGELKSIDREDWGLSFTLEKTGESTLLLICKQSGGQQIGQLEIRNIAVYQVSSDSRVCSTDDIFQITTNF